MRISSSAVIKDYVYWARANKQPDGQAAIPDQKAVPLARNSSWRMQCEPSQEKVRLIILLKIFKDAVLGEQFLQDK